MAQAPTDGSGINRWLRHQPMAQVLTDGSGINLSQVSTDGGGSRLRS